MARSYEELFGELEEEFPLEGERRVELPQALESITEHLHPVEVEMLPPSVGLLGRVLAQAISLAAVKGASPALEAGTVLEHFHLGPLTEAGLAEVAVRRRPSVATLLVGETPDRELSAPFLPLVSRLTSLAALSAWSPEVQELGTVPAEGEALWRALAQGVSADLLCVVVGEPKHLAVRETTRKLGARILFAGLPCQPGGLTGALLRQNCLLLLLAVQSYADSLLHRLLLDSALGVLTGIPPAPPQQLPTERDLPLTGAEGVLIPASLVRNRVGLTVRPLGEIGHPSEANVREAVSVIYLPPHSLPREQGDAVTVLSLSSQRLATPPAPDKPEEPPR